MTRVCFQVFNQQQFFMDVEKEAVKYINEKFHMNLKSLEDLNQVQQVSLVSPPLIGWERYIQEVVMPNLPIKQEDYTRILEANLIGTIMDEKQVKFVVCDDNGENISTVLASSCKIKMEEK